MSSGFPNPSLPAPGPESRVPSPEPRSPGPASPASSPWPRVPVLNAIVDSDCAARAGWTLTDLAAAFLDGGARFLQLRAKHLPGGAFLAAADAIVARAATYDARVVVNDRADIAALAEAGGVHVGQDDLSPAQVRLILGAGAIVGLSTHTEAQIEAAVLQPITYLAIGPVFGTRTKETGYDAVGLARVRHAAGRAAAHGLPVVAIGGITADNAADVLRAGAASVAVIGDLLTGRDPAARVRLFLDRLESAGQHNRSNV